MTIALQTAKKYITYLQSLDIQGITSLFADDIIQKIPFAPIGTETKVTGKENVAKIFEGLPYMFTKITYADIEYFATNDATTAIVFASASATLSNNQPYFQQYVFYIKVNENGLIQEYREYMNPNQLQKAIDSLSL